MWHIADMSTLSQCIEGPLRIHTRPRRPPPPNVNMYGRNISQILDLTFLVLVTLHSKPVDFFRLNNNIHFRKHLQECHEKRTKKSLPNLLAAKISSFLFRLKADFLSHWQLGNKNFNHLAFSPKRFIVCLRQKESPSEPL